MSNNAHIDKLAAQAAELRRAGDDPQAKRIYESTEIQEVIQEIATHLKWKFSASGMDTKEYLGAAYVWIWSRLAKFESGEGFIPWCRTLATNCAIDELRREDRRPKINESELGNDQALADIHDDDSSLDEVRPELSERDYQRIGEWGAEIGLLLSAAWCIWPNAKSPLREVWSRWLNDFGLSDDEAAEFERDLFVEDETERFAMIADLFDQSLNTIQQRWRRCQHWIVRLDYLWDDVFARYYRFSDNDLAKLKQLDNFDRVVGLCLFPCWFRANSREEFTSLVDLEARRADFPWLRFLLRATPDLEDRVVLLSRESGLRRPEDELRACWKKNLPLLSEMEFAKRS